MQVTLRYEEGRVSVDAPQDAQVSEVVSALVGAFILVVNRFVPVESRANVVRIAVEQIESGVKKEGP